MNQRFLKAKKENGVEWKRRKNDMSFSKRQSNCWKTMLWQYQHSYFLPKSLLVSWQSRIRRKFFPQPLVDDSKIRQPPSGSTHLLRLCGFDQLSGLGPDIFSCLWSINPHFCFTLGYGLSWVFNNWNWIVEMPQETLPIHRPLTLKSITVCKKRGTQMPGESREGARECFGKQERESFPWK